MQSEAPPSPLLLPTNEELTEESKRQRRKKKRQTKQHRRKWNKTDRHKAKEQDEVDLEGGSYPYLVLGSEDSLDEDRIYILPAKPAVDTCYAFCNFPLRQTKPTEEAGEDGEKRKMENRNIVVVEAVSKGEQEEEVVICDCFKGSADAIQNCVIRTYALHPQAHSNPFHRLLHRNVPLRVIKALRDLLGLLCRALDTQQRRPEGCDEENKKTEQGEGEQQEEGKTINDSKWKQEQRQSIKQALRSNNYNQRRLVLAGIDFADERWWLSDGMSASVWKTIAFHLAQSVALMQGRELFTKQAIIDEFASLAPFMHRQAKGCIMANLGVCLNEFRDQFLEMIAPVEPICNGTLVMLRVASAPSNNAWNHFSYQSRGMVIDVRKEQCLSFPLEHYYVFQQTNHNVRIHEWPSDEDLLTKHHLLPVFRSPFSLSFDREESACEPEFFTAFKYARGTVIVSETTGFRVGDGVQADIQSQLQNLPNPSFYPIFQRTERGIRLVAFRHHLTHDLLLPPHCGCASSSS
ncbi:hypothetical protein QOT17_016447 [Balamuthia mandrillaris]